MTTTLLANASKTDGNNNNKQWIEITSLSSFTTKWSLFSSLNKSFGNVLNVVLNANKRSAKVLFGNLESAQKCCKWFTSNRVLDGECIEIYLCSESNITQRNAQKCHDILNEKLNGFIVSSERIKCCAENIETLTPFFISKCHSKILLQLSETQNNKKSAIFVTDAFSVIGVDAYCFSDCFHTINALNSHRIFYSNLVDNIKLFGRFATPIKCLNLNFHDIYNNLCQHIVYIDSFNMNMNTNNKLKWNDCCADISYSHRNKSQYLSQFCVDIYRNNQIKMNNKNNNINNKQIVALMLIAVKVPKHFMVSEFAEKVKQCQCQIIVFDFECHQLMVLDFQHNINELRSLEFKCNKFKDLCFFKTFIFQRFLDPKPVLKKRKLNNYHCIVSEKEIAFQVSTHLKEIGFKSFGVEHTKNFNQKLKIQIYSKQMIREIINFVDLKSKFKEIQQIESFIKENGKNNENKTWIAPNIIGPRYLIYATSQWTILVDECLNMFYHPTFNEFYQNILFGTNSNKQQTLNKSVTILDGFLIPSNYFKNDQNKNKKNRNNGISPLQFWILDILSYQNNTSVVLRDRFNYFQNIVASYNRECKYLHSGPISIHSLHFEEYNNLNNLLQFVHSDKEKQCVIYQTNECVKYAINGFVLIDNGTQCIIHDRNKYSESCVLWKCDFNALFTQYFIQKRKQTKNTDMFQK